MGATHEPDGHLGRQLADAEAALVAAGNAVPGLTDADRRAFAKDAEALRSDWATVFSPPAVPAKRKPSPAGSVMSGAADLGGGLAGLADGLASIGEGIAAMGRALAGRPVRRRRTGR